jgi:hypothetical protein
LLVIREGIPMSQSPTEQQKLRLSPSETATLHEVAAQVRAEIARRYGEAALASELALFERLVGGRLERGLDVLMNSSVNSAQFQYALCWLDGFDLSPAFQLCWSEKRFRSLLRLRQGRCKLSGEELG